MGNDRVAERQRGMQMAGPFAHLVDTVARDMHYNESLHLHDVTERFEKCGYCYLRAGRTLGHVAQALAPVELVPVEVFGGDCGHVTDGVLCEAPFSYGLSDAVPAWSDCNRARGRIYRVEDVPGPRESGDSLTVWAAQADLPWFERRFGDAPDECTLVGLPRELAEQLASHTPRTCGVCLGISPSRDGHDQNPPCVGYAREVLQEVLNGREG